MIDINESNFAEETSSGLVLVDFYAQWCGPCKAMIPTLESLQNVKVVKVNTDFNQNLAAQYNVSAIPMLVFLKDGVQVDKMIGVVSADKLQTRINELQ